MIVAPDSSQVSTIGRAPRSLTGNLTWRLIRYADGSDAIAESSDDIRTVDIGHPWQLRYDRPYTAPTAEGKYLAIWRSGGQEIATVVVVSATDTAAFATAGDVALRLGRDLTAGETNSVTWLLQMAASLIADTAGRDDGWAITLSPVPTILKGLSVELAVRALANPNQLSMLQEQLGAYSMRAAFPADRMGLALTKTEELIVRRAVYGRTTDSVKIGSGFAQADRLLWWDHQGPIQWIQ